MHLCYYVDRHVCLPLLEARMFNVVLIGSYMYRCLVDTYMYDVLNEW